MKFSLENVLCGKCYYKFQQLDVKSYNSCVTDKFQAQETCLIIFHQCHIDAGWKRTSVRYMNIDQIMGRILKH